MFDFLVIAVLMPLLLLGYFLLVRANQMPACVAPPPPVQSTYVCVAVTEAEAEHSPDGGAAERRCPRQCQRLRKSVNTCHRSLVRVQWVELMFSGLVGGWRECCMGGVSAVCLSEGEHCSSLCL